MTDYYWHFAKCDEDGVPRLRYGDGREVKVDETLTVDGELILCKAGLHASQRIIDALRYAGGDRVCLCRVTLGGNIVHGDDKSAATKRTVYAILDAGTTDKLLRDFARWCALQVIHLWDAPDIVLEFLEAGDESKRAAARAAAWDAARAAAWATAWAAAWAAARAAAEAAADAAARAAAQAATDAARAAADAAWAAAWDAARDAARDATDAAQAAQNVELERRMLEAMGLR